MLSPSPTSRTKGKVAAIPASPAADVCCVDLDAQAPRRDELFSLLSDVERDRAHRYRQTRDGMHFIFRRGLLRELLAARLGCAPEEIPIATATSGKPYVAGSDLQFSVSNANGTGLYAFARRTEIGCDIEWLHAGVASLRAVDLFLSPRELEYLKQCDGREQTNQLLHYWTCKEAYLKARGTGLMVAPQRVVVSDDLPARFLALPDAEPSDWSLAALQLPAGYIGAVVVHGSALRRTNQNGAEVSFRAA